MSATGVVGAGVTLIMAGLEHFHVQLDGESQSAIMVLLLAAAHWASMKWGIAELDSGDAVQPAKNVTNMPVNVPEGTKVDAPGQQAPAVGAGTLHAAPLATGMVPGGSPVTLSGAAAALGSKN
jgi:hypothetical protein